MAVTHDVYIHCTPKDVSHAKRRMILFTVNVTFPLKKVGSQQVNFIIIKKCIDPVDVYSSLYVVD